MRYWHAQSTDWRERRRGCGGCALAVGAFQCLYYNSEGRFGVVFGPTGAFDLADVRSQFWPTNAEFLHQSVLRRAPGLVQPWASG